LREKPHNLTSRLLRPAKEAHESLATWFLDQQAFQRQNRNLPTICLDIDPSVLALLGETDFIVKQYFEKLHWWMPIISPTLLLDAIKDDPAKQDSSLSVLLLAIQVLLWYPPKQQYQNPRTNDYQIVKQLLADSISLGTLSFLLLQAQVLVAIYELGHAIYPAAYLSIGSCACYGAALEVDQSLRPGYFPQTPFLRPLEVEERRRTWWAITILDR
jgi:hypothetical protein